MQPDSLKKRIIENFAKVFKPSHFTTESHYNSFSDNVKIYNMDFVHHIFLFLVMLTFVTYSSACVRRLVFALEGEFNFAKSD